MEDVENNKVLVVTSSDVMNGLVTCEKRLTYHFYQRGLGETDIADEYKFAHNEIYPYHYDPYEWY